MRFTAEELEELRLADEEIEASFCQTQEEIEASRRRDRESVLDRLDAKGRKIAESQKAYREANREKIAESQKAYYEANREKIAESKKAVLRNYRKQLGFSQFEFAKVVGVTPSLVSHWECGRAYMNVALVSLVFPDLALAYECA